MGDSDEEGRLAWEAAGSPLYQEGAGYVGPNGLASNYVPSAPVQPAASPTASLWDYEVSQNTGFRYAPEQLGWSPEEAARFKSAGNNLLPAFMAKELIYSPEFKLSGRDPIATYNTLATGDVNQLSGELSGARKAKQYLEGSGGDLSGDAGKEAFIRTSFGNILNGRDSWWDRNKGAVIGVGGMLTVGLGGYLSGAMAATDAALVGGTAAAGTGGGGLYGTTAGLSATGGTGLYGTGQGLTAGLGGLYGTGVGTTTQGLGALGSGAGAVAGGYGGNALSEGFGGLGGDIAGYSNATPISANGTDLSGAIAAGQAGGADVGMGAGTSWLTDLGLPASYGSGLGGLAGYGYDALGSAATSGGSKVASNSSIWDTVSGLFGGSGGGGISDNALLQLINAGIGGAGTYFGGQAQADASDKASDTLWNMYQQSRADSASQRALLDQSLPFMQDRTYNAQSYMPTIPTLQNEVNVDYANDPIYQAQQNELLRTLNRRYASQGRNMSSSADDALLRGQVPLMQDSYSRNLDTLNRTNQNALSTYGLGYQQQGDIYGRGLDLTKIGAGAAAQAGQNALSSGNALAANQIGAGNNTANMYGGLAGVGMGSINNYMLYNLLSQRKAA